MVGYSENLYDAEFPYHFYCEWRSHSEVTYAMMEYLEMEDKSALAKEGIEKRLN